MVYATDVAILVGLGSLLARRVIDAQVRFVSLFQDYFALYLLIGVAASGVALRYAAWGDVVAVKQLALGLDDVRARGPGRRGAARSSCTCSW